MENNSVHFGLVHRISDWILLERWRSSFQHILFSVLCFVRILMHLFSYWCWSAVFVCVATSQPWSCGTHERWLSGWRSLLCHLLFLDLWIWRCLVWRRLYCAWFGVGECVSDYIYHHHWGVAFACRDNFNRSHIAHKEIFGASRWSRDPHASQHLSRGADIAGRLHSRKRMDGQENARYNDPQQGSYLDCCGNIGPIVVVWKTWCAKDGVGMHSNQPVPFPRFFHGIVLCSRSQQGSSIDTSFATCWRVIAGSNNDIYWQVQDESSDAQLLVQCHQIHQGWGYHCCSDEYRDWWCELFSISMFESSPHQEVDFFFSHSSQVLVTHRSGRFWSWHCSWKFASNISRNRTIWCQ